MRTGVAASKRPWKLAAHHDPDPASAAASRLAPAVVGSRKKGAGVRAWQAVDANGEARVVEAGKQAIMRWTGLPARDLRILDPQLSYPSSLLGRDRAIVVSLEHIKSIITAHEVLVLNFGDPAVVPFVQELRRRLLHRQNVQEVGVSKNVEWTSHASGLEEPKIRSNRQRQTSADDTSGASEVVGTEVDGKNKGEPASSQYKQKDLPFEFIALEACLEATCSCLENEATMLENEAHPALDKLTSKISTLNLEHVRQIKSRLVAITGRVQKVRDELEHLLDDDDDMAEMYLTDKLMHQDLSDGSSDPPIYNHGIIVDDNRVSGEISPEGDEIGNNLEAQNSNHPLDLSERNITNLDSHFIRTFSTQSSRKHLYVDDLEMLLEAYFVQIDSTLNKLSTLREYVDDTEDYINIMLDDKQNQLLQMGVVLTAATSIISAFIVLVGIFGMNIDNDLYDKEKSGAREFSLTVGGGALGFVVLYVISIAWCRQRGLLE